MGDPNLSSVPISRKTFFELEMDLSLHIESQNKWCLSWIKAHDWFKPLELVKTIFGTLKVIWVFLYQLLPNYPEIFNRNKFAAPLKWGIRSITSIQKRELS